MPQESPDHETPAGTLEKEHLVLGLCGLSAAHRAGWGPGHHGAALIASAYLRAENPIAARTERALRSQAGAFLRSRSKFFPTPDPGPGNADPALIAERLSASIGTLRSGGHDAIYASLALRVLKELPELATPKIVDGVCKLLEVFVRDVPPAPVPDHHRSDPPAPYEGPDDVVDVTLRALLRPWNHVLEVGAGNVVHWITHADALLTLEELGFEDLARSGYPAHRQYVDHPVTPGSEAEPESAPVDWFGPEYWESDAPRTVQKGTWFFGHSFKLPYSLLRLLRRVDGPARREACLVRASKLSLPFA